MRATRQSPTELSIPWRGIDQVIRHSNEVAQLPHRQAITPSEISDRPQLDKIFSEESFSHFIALRLRPDISDTDLLSPARFRDILMNIRSSLRALARRNPKTARHFGQLAAILDEESDLVDLLQMYRSALLQG